VSAEGEGCRTVMGWAIVGARIRLFRLAGSEGRKRLAHGLTEHGLQLRGGKDSDEGRGVCWTLVVDWIRDCVRVYGGRNAGRV
jgi:hypothetical protein